MVEPQDNSCARVGAPGVTPVECISHQEAEKGGEMAFPAEVMGQRQGRMGAGLNPTWPRSDEEAGPSEEARTLASARLGGPQCHTGDGALLV